MCSNNIEHILKIENAKFKTTDVLSLVTKCGD